MLKLMNTAMMPISGEYILTKITQNDFVFYLKNARIFESYIGYDTTAEFINRISGVTVTLNREQTTLKNGDEMLICKLKYRLPDPNQKGKYIPTNEDYEFFFCKYFDTQY